MAVSGRRASQLTRSRQRTRDSIAAKLKPELERFWAGQARRAVAVFLDRDTRALPGAEITYKNLNPNEIIPPADDLRLSAVLQKRILQMIISTSESVAELLGSEALTDVSPEVVRMLTQAGERIKDINAVTRSAVQDTLNQGTARGLSDFQIANGVTERRDAAGKITREAFRGLRETVKETYKDRALTVARTEMAVTNNQASIASYRSAGVSEVDIIDGPECGWASHDDPDKADGSRRTLAEYARQPLAHPNCLRSDVPVLP